MTHTYIYVSLCICDIYIQSTYIDVMCAYSHVCRIACVCACMCKPMYMCIEAWGGHRVSSLTTSHLRYWHRVWSVSEPGAFGLSGWPACCRDPLSEPATWYPIPPTFTVGSGELNVCSHSVFNTFLLLSHKHTHYSVYKPTIYLLRIWKKESKNPV